MQAEFKWGSNSNTSAPSNSVRVAQDRRTLSGRFAAAICESYDEPDEVDEICNQIKAQLGGENPDLALIFASSPKYPKFEDVLPDLQRQLGIPYGSRLFGIGRDRRRARA